MEIQKKDSIMLSNCGSTEKLRLTVDYAKFWIKEN